MGGFCRNLKLQILETIGIYYSFVTDPIFFIMKKGYDKGYNVFDRIRILKKIRSND